MSGLVEWSGMTVDGKHMTYRELLDRLGKEARGLLRMAHRPRIPEGPDQDQVVDMLIRGLQLEGVAWGEGRIGLSWAFAHWAKAALTRLAEQEALRQAEREEAVETLQQVFAETAAVRTAEREAADKEMVAIQDELNEKVHKLQTQLKQALQVVQGVREQASTSQAGLRTHIADLRLALRALAERPAGDPAKPPSAALQSRDSIHNWFSLSYASHLVIPRSVLQSMPPEWQCEFVRLVEQLEAVRESQGVYEPEGGYRVSALGADKKFISDEFGDYERGRRKVLDIPRARTVIQRTKQEQSDAYAQLQADLLASLAAPGEE